MKEGVQFQPLYIGIDVSKLTLEVSCINADGVNRHQQFENNKTGFKHLQRWLCSLEGFSYAQALFCLEHTGIYTRQLIDFLLLQGARVWRESALHLKRSLGLTRVKSDKVDAYRIARYAMVNREVAKLITPSNVTLQRLKDLHSSKARLTKVFSPLRCPSVNCNA